CEDVPEKGGVRGGDHSRLRASRRAWYSGVQKQDVSCKGDGSLFITSSASSMSTSVSLSERGSGDGMTREDEVKWVNNSLSVTQTTCASRNGDQIRSATGRRATCNMAHPASDDSCASTEVNSAASRLHAELQAAGAHGTAISEKVQDILRVIPLNTEARRAFDTVAQAAKKGSLDALHAQYVCITGEQSLEHEPVDAGNETGETSEDETPTHRPTIILAGYYRLQFALAAVSKTPTWVIGRGSGQKFGPTRNVDIILVAPGTKVIQGLAAAHVYLSICTDSGAWRIAAGAKMQVEDESYKPGESIHLYQPKTRIQILNMQYLIRFEVDTEELEVEYIKVRNKMLRKEGFSLPHTEISGIPFQGDMVFNSIVFRHGIGSGTFGSVYEGFGPKTGELRVAKRIILHSAQQAPEVSREIQALQRFNGSIGILGLIDWRTSLN
ncbi:MAG: hypothetical protein Q9180_006552, partial [Flavoplaca navasiana]